MRNLWTLILSSPSATTWKSKSSKLGRLLFFPLLQRKKTETWVNLLSERQIRQKNGIKEKKEHFFTAIIHSNSVSHQSASAGCGHSCFHSFVHVTMWFSSHCQEILTAFAPAKQSNRIRHWVNSIASILKSFHSDNSWHWSFRVTTLHVNLSSGAASHPGQNSRDSPVFRSAQRSAALGLIKPTLSPVHTLDMTQQPGLQPASQQKLHTDVRGTAAGTSWPRPVKHLFI